MPCIILTFSRCRCISAHLFLKIHPISDPGNLNHSVDRKLSWFSTWMRRYSERRASVQWVEFRCCEAEYTESELLPYKSLSLVVLMLSRVGDGNYASVVSAVHRVAIGPTVHVQLMVQKYRLCYWQLKPYDKYINKLTTVWIWFTYICVTLQSQIIDHCT